MAVRSRRLFGPLTAPAATATLAYTVPVGRTLIIRSMVAVCQGAGTTYYVLVNGTSGATNSLVYNRAIATGDRHVYQENWMLNPGDILRVYNVANGTILYWGFGSLLLGEPV